MQHTSRLDNKQYYNVFDDLRDYPQAIVLIAYSRRGVGKTYGALYGALERKQPIVYIKRTIEDINLICSGTSEFDTSPYVPINRDHGTNIKPKRIANGIGAFYHTDSDGDPIGAPVAYAVALSAIKNVKGIDLSHCDFCIFDEFIPQISESRILHTEGEAVLDLYMTLNRDREKRGKDPIKLLLFANSEMLYCPVIEELDVMDDIAKIAITGCSYNYIEDRKILIHHVNEIVITEEEKNGMYQVMKGTAWHRKSFGGEFSKADFSNVSNIVLKKFVPLMCLIYKESEFYIYRHDDDYYICKKKSNRVPITMNLNRDNDVRMFYARYCLDIQEACIEGHVKFSDYSLYDLIMNYGKRFKGIL